MIQYSVKVLHFTQKNAFRKFFEGMPSLCAASNEMHITNSISRKRSLYNMVNTSSISVLKRHNTGLPISSSLFNSPWRDTPNVSFGSIARCYSSVTSGNGNNDNGDSPEDTPPGMYYLDS